MENNNRELPDQQGCLENVLYNQQQMIEKMNNQKGTTDMKMKVENMEIFPRNKVRSFWALPVD